LIGDEMNIRKLAKLLSASVLRTAVAVVLGLAVTSSTGCGSLFPSSVPGVGALMPGQQDAALKRRAEADKFPSAQQPGI
jgi:hypothetical protein